MNATREFKRERERVQEREREFKRERESSREREREFKRERETDGDGDRRAFGVEFADVREDLLDDEIEKSIAAELLMNLLDRKEIKRSKSLKSGPL